MKRLFSLFTLSLFLLTFVGAKLIVADVVGPLRLTNVIIGDDMGGKNITYSNIAGVNFTVQKRGETGSFVQAYLNMEETDWTDAEYVYMQVSNPFWGEVGVGISLIDSDGSLFRADVDWSDPEWAALPENSAKHNYWLLDSLDDATPTLRHLGWGAAFIPGNFTGYIKLPINVFDYRWGVKSGNNETLELNAITRIELDMDIYNNEFSKLTWGNIYQGSDEHQELVFNGSNVTKASGEDTGSSYYIHYNGNEDNVRDEVLFANQLSNYKYNMTNNQHWSPFYVVMPTDISSYNGISYYVDNTLENKEVFFNKFIREFKDGVSGEEWYCDGGFAFYQSDDGEEFVGQANVIPAGFKGTITVPFSNFAIPGWFTPINGVKDFDSVWWNLGFTFDMSIRTNKFIIKDFYLVSDAYQFIRLPQESFTKGDMKVVLPFEYYDDFDLSSDWFTNWDKAANCEIELVDSPIHEDYDVGGKAMKFNVGSMKTVEGASHETALEHYPNTDDQKNIDGAKGITFFIKNDTSSQIGFNFGFDLLLSQGVQQRWTTSINARYMLFDLKNGIDSVNNAKDGIYVPAGFEGYVRIGFDEFANPSWETKSAPFDPSKPVAYMVINVNAIRHEGESFILDNFGYYYSDVEIKTTFRNVENTFEKALGIVG